MSTAARNVEPWLTVIGIGDDGEGSLSAPARALLDRAETVIAPERVLASLDLAGKKVEPWTGRLHETVAALVKRRGERITILATGDPMHFGVGATLARHVPFSEMRVVPSPSAFSLAAARLGWTLQETDCISMHGRAVARLRLFLAPGARIIALTSNGRTVREAAELLVAEGYGGSALAVLEHMGGAAERRIDLCARDAVDGEFADFNTLAIDCVADPGLAVRPFVPGLANEAFAHDGRITKREVRAVTLAALAPYPGALLWDVGAGCGSVAVEWMRAARGARAIAIEPREDRRAMIADNALALGVPGIDIVSGQAPAALDGLAAPDAVFIGGGISAEGVFEAAWQALRPGGRLAANAVTLEGEARLIALRRDRGGELTRIAVSHAEPVGAFHGWRPSMPVTMWSVAKEGGA